MYEATDIMPHVAIFYSSKYNKKRKPIRLLPLSTTIFYPTPNRGNAGYCSFVKSGYGSQNLFSVCTQFLALTQPVNRLLYLCTSKIRCATKTTLVSSNRIDDIQIVMIRAITGGVVGSIAEAIWGVEQLQAECQKIWFQ